MDTTRAIPYGDYFLTRKIATGGMAELFRALKIGAAGFEKLLVVKRLLPHLAADQEIRDMFLDEARLASQLNHISIAQVYDLGRAQAADPDRPQAETTYFIAMEYVFGKSLAEVIRGGQERGKPLSVQNAARITSNAAAALDYAHEKTGTSGEPLGLVHRDVSPQNILISYEGEVKLVDFGIAKALSSSTTTRPGTLKGKFSYMAPEQAKGAEVDRRTDVYALGIVMWEALTGQRLFAGESEAVVLSKVLSPEVAPPSELNPEVPEELEEVCLKALAPEPEDRFQTAAAMQDAIEVWLHSLLTYPSSYTLRSHMQELFGDQKDEESRLIQEEQTAVRRAAQGEEVEQPAQAKPPTSADSTQIYDMKKAQAQERAQEDQPAGGGKGKLLAVVASLVVVAAVAGYFMLSGSKPPPEPARPSTETTAQAPAPEKEKPPAETSGADQSAETTAPKTADAAAAGQAEAGSAAGDKASGARPGAESAAGQETGQTATGSGSQQEAEAQPEPSGDTAGHPETQAAGAKTDAGQAGTEAPPQAEIPPLVAQGRDALEARRYADALAVLDQAVAEDPALALMVARDRAGALLGLAAEKLHDDPDAALQHLQRAADLAPEWGEVFLQLGRVHTKLEQYLAALEAYDRAIALGPPWNDVGHFNKGYILLKQKDYRKAADAYLQVVGMDSPHEADAWLNLAVCHYKLGDVEAAREDLRRALAENPNLTQAQKYLDKLESMKPGDSHGGE